MTLFHDNDSVDEAQEVDGVGDEDPSFLFEMSEHHILKNRLLNIGIES